MSKKEAFFSEPNEQMLDRLLYNHMKDECQKQFKRDLDERDKQRLVKTVKHYMGEVFKVNGKMDVQGLNKEVLGAAAPDYRGYLRRRVETETSSKTEVEVVMGNDPLRTDVGTRFALMQESRNEVKQKVPPPPDFRIPLDEDDTQDALSIFENAKKLREAEAARDAKTLEEIRLRTGQMRPIEAGELIRTKALENESPFDTPQQQPPDLRTLLFGSTPLNRNPVYRQDTSGLAQANPTVAVPQTITNRPVLPQDFVQKEDDVMNYKENEFNLFVYSADRDWLVSTGENRYNFSVLFNPGNVTSGLRPNAATQIKFKNITRIELVKAMMPVEGIEVLIDKSSQSAFTTTVNTNALSFPYLQVRVPELDTNNFGTNFTIDNAFGIIQYDANWITDNNNVTQRGGFIAMIPKFLKCQKVYYPTPLSTLQKLTIRIERPDGTPLSIVPDTLDISGFLLSNLLDGTNNSNTNYVLNGASAGLSQFLWIQTKSWFSRFMFNVGDRVVFRGITMPSSFTGNQAVTQDFINWLQDPQGHLIVNIGYKTGATIYQGYTTGVNSVGYANYIILDTRYYNPSTGSTSVWPYGGVASNTFASALWPDPSGPITPTAGRFINISHQTQLVFRVITRDMDSASRLRPDNLN
jgi:hypothetical protein